MRSSERLLAFAGRAGRWLSRSFLLPQLPLLAVEVRPQALAAVRLVLERGRPALGAAAWAPLAPGIVEVSLTRGNLLDLDGFRAALRALLERVGALAGGPLSLVLPDPAVRIALVPAAGVRGRRREAAETLRFRLHKALPFDARSARLVWAARGSQLLVTVAPEAVVGGYEEAIEGLGHQVGLVEPASLALAAALPRGLPDSDRLLVNWDQGYVSFSILRGEEPLLVRTLAGEDGAEAVARHAASTLQFYSDRLQGPGLSEVLLRAAALPPQESLAAIEAGLGLTPRLLQPWAALGLAENDETTQAVAGAAACASRRAA